MSVIDLPTSAKAMAAMGPMRWRHRYWHLVKSPDFVNDPRNARLVQALAAIGWTAARTGAPGSGIDFLAMHRAMIRNMDQSLAAAGDPNWPKVEGWAQIPVAANDPDWPEPPIPNLSTPSAFPANLQDTMVAIADARSAPRVQQMLNIAAQLRDPAVLVNPALTLDQYGMIIEGTVHNWMHMRYSGPPPADTEAEDPSNDWLARPYSSHVNPYFWKLHGWIDDCIEIWAAARGVSADLSSAWVPPTVAPPWDVLLAPVVTSSVAPPSPFPGPLSVPEPGAPEEGLVEPAIGSAFKISEEQVSRFGALIGG